MGRPRKIKSVKALEDAWAEYKEFCDEQNVIAHEFSAKNSEFVSKKLQRKITYTIDPGETDASIDKGGVIHTGSSLPSKASAYISALRAPNSMRHTGMMSGLGTR